MLNTFVCTKESLRFGVNINRYLASIVLNYLRIILTSDKKTYDSI